MTRRQMEMVTELMDWKLMLFVKKMWSLMMVFVKCKEM